MNNMKFSGAGTIPAGEYNDIACSGATKVNGNVTCKSFSASGACGCSGNIECLEDFKTSGSISVDGDVKCSGNFKCSGSAKLKNVNADDIRISGSLSATSLQGKSINISGGIRINGDVEGENVNISGGGSIEGLLNAEIVSIKTGESLHIGSIGGTQIRVEENVGSGDLRIFGFTFKNKVKNSKLTTESVEGDEIYLENTEANVVRGKNVIIGTNCKINRVEYSGTYECHETSTVKETVKL